jgi:TctA family transporter
VLYPAILLFCVVGAYSLNNNVFDVYMTIPFAVLGYVFKKLDCEPAPLLLGFVLGKLMEEYLRRAMTISRGDWSVFVTRPLSLTMLLMALALLVLVFLPAIASKRREAFTEEEN